MPVALIRRLETFIGLTDDEKSQLRQAFRHRRAAPPGDGLFQEGDPVPGVTIMIDGLGYRYKQLPNGRRQIVAYLLPGDVVSSGTLTAETLDYSVHLMTPSILSTIHGADLMALHPNLLRSIWSIVGRELSITWEWVANVGQRDARARVAHLFCELYYRMLEVGLVHEASFAFPASQQEIADSVGITNVHANRTLQSLRREGVLIFDGKRLAISNIAGLKRIGMLNCTPF